MLYSSKITTILACGFAEFIQPARFSLPAWESIIAWSESEMETTYSGSGSGRILSTIEC
jgi:hypothetical protein